MAPRFSLPSASVGINRFHCWPVDTTDSYSASDLTANWDYLDALLGAPSGGAAWPPTTGLDGGIYKLILNLQNGSTPIGATAHWFRPSTLVPLTTITDAGWHVADGTTLNSSQHSFPGMSGMNVTLPNMLHRGIIGADPNLSLGQAPAAVGTGNIDAAAGAPGANALGGSNQIVQTTSQMPGHSHSFTGSPLASHNHSWSGAEMGTHSHYSVDYPDPPYTDHQHLVEFKNDTKSGGTSKSVADFGGAAGATDIYLGIEFSTSADSAGTPVGSNTPVSAGTPSGSIGSAGSGNPMDNRALWIGLIPIIKVRTIS